MVMTAGAGRNSVPKLFDDLSFEGRESNNTSLPGDSLLDLNDENSYYDETKENVKDFNETIISTPAQYYKI